MANTNKPKTDFNSDTPFASKSGGGWGKAERVKVRKREQLRRITQNNKGVR